MMHHLVCFSGGESSARVAVAVVRRFGPKAVTLLNHDISPNNEHADVKRFKAEVAAALGLPITYANYGGLSADELPDQFDVCQTAFKRAGTGNALCTYYLKTAPFDAYLAAHHLRGPVTIYYGFDDDEQHRIRRRRDILGARGYATVFPLAEWPDTLESITEIGIAPPLTYSTYRHANCAGCLKGGLQHWFVTYCHRPDVYEKASQTEQRLGYAILPDRSGGARKPWFLADLAPVFARMKCAGVPDTEHYPEHKFKHYLRQYRLPEISLFAPCECST